MKTSTLLLIPGGALFGIGMGPELYEFAVGFIGMTLIYLGGYAAGEESMCHETDNK